MIIEVSKEAAQELEESVAWYEKEDPELGARLVDAFAHAARRLKELQSAAGSLGWQSGPPRRQTTTSASLPLFPSLR